MSHYVKKFVKIFTATILVFFLVAGIAFCGAVLGYWGNIDDLEVETLILNRNSSIVYNDPETGEEKELHKISSAENREWADIENIPEDLQNAFVAIEDERFFEHRGVDIPRTTKATFAYIGNKLIGRSSSFGGSTITQQLIKNITGEREQTPARKILEISRAVALEKEVEKTEILEMYLNCIYLSHGCNGVQTASKAYFDKDVSELDLAECASIAGITQNPAAYDPINNPENNKKRQMMVLGKMKELGYITQDEYDSAASKELVFSENAEEVSGEIKTNSYYVDQVLNDVMRDLQAQGYSKTLATNILYSGGVKIYTSYNPEIQNAVENYYSNMNNFPKNGIQSAITVVDVRTGQIVGIAGGIGEKTASLTLNRASQSPRQPGSTIKPIAAYAPALEKGIITPGSVFDDSAKSYNGWTPRNYDYAYRGNVDVRRAVRTSLNTTPVEIISKMGARESYDFLKENLGFTTLVESRDVNGKIYSDIGLAQLALGGLTDGMTTVEMAAAYSAFANGGIYNKPYIYTEVKDSDGNVILSNTGNGKVAMKESTAFLMTQLLKEVVSSGTGGGASVSGVSYTAGKTGTTSDNNDRWFVGYTPYYAAAIWYGYDTPKEIYASGNPCIPIFRNIMNEIHKTLDDRSRRLEIPSDVVRISYCTYSGKRATDECPAESYYFSQDNIPSYCGVSSHPVEEEEKTDEEENQEGENAEGGTGESTSESATGTAGSTAGGGTSGATVPTPGESSSSGGTTGDSSPETTIGAIED